jgi:hypothetical protein
MFQRVISTSHSRTHDTYDIPDDTGHMASKTAISVCCITSDALCIRKCGFYPCSLASTHGPVPTGLDVLALYQRVKDDSIENIKDGRYVQKSIILPRDAVNYVPILTGIDDFEPSRRAGNGSIGN